MLLKKTLRRSILIPSFNLSNINNELLRILRGEIQERITSDGYIVSINRIVSKSVGKTMASSIDGSVKFDVNFECDILNIEENNILIGCTINNITPIGIFASYKNYINILLIKKKLPANFDTFFKINNTINIKIVKFTYELTQKRINLIGEIYFYNYIEPFENRYVNLIKDGNEDNFNLDVIYSDSIDDTPNNLELGYGKQIPDLLTSILNIDNDIWNYYVNYTNPFNQLTSKKDYNIFTEIFHLIDKKFSNVFIINETDGLLNKIKEMKLKTKGKYDLVIGNNGQDFIDFSIDIEHFSMKGIFKDVYDGLNKLEKKGTFILKVFNLYTYPMVQLIDILKKLFEKSHIFKPETSNMNNSVRYLIFDGFIDIDKNTLNGFNDISKSKYKYPKLLYPIELINQLTINWVLASNIKIAEIQLRKLNEIIDTIEFYNYKKNNDTQFVKEQKIISDEWIKKYK